MTGVDHEHSEAALIAAEWLSKQHSRPTPLVPFMRQRFNLSALEACEAIAQASRIIAREGHAV